MRINANRDSLQAFWPQNLRLKNYKCFWENYLKCDLKQVEVINPKVFFLTPDTLSQGLM